MSRVALIRRVAAVATVALFALAGFTGCGVVADTSKRKAEMEAVAAEIQLHLAQLPGVVTVEAGYDNDLEQSARGWARFKVKAGTDFQPVFEETLRTMWLSRLNPLRSTYVQIVEDVPGKVEERNSYFGETPADGTHLRADLEKKYGPHPTE